MLPPLLAVVLGLAVLPVLAEGQTQSGCPVPGDLRPCVCTSERGAVYIT